MNGVPLIQGGQGGRDQTTAGEMLTAVLICGLLIFLAAPIVKWVTGFTDKEVAVDVDGNDDIDLSGVDEKRTYWTDEAGEIHDGDTEDEILDHALPAETSTIFDKLILGIRGIAAFVMIIALVWGGIKLRARRLSNLPRSRRGER